MNTFNNNSVQLVGNLGQDVNLISFDTGNKKATFSLATSESFTNKDGDTIKTTQWHNVIAWGKNADMLSKSVSKGHLIEVQGKIQYRNYQDSHGNIKYITEIIMTNFKKLKNTIEVAI